MKRFARSEDGFVYVMVLLFIPVLMGVALLVIDIGRGNNAHSDLYAAADAVALAGARELDGGEDSIDRAKAAMAEISNSVNMLAPSGADVHIDLVYEDAEGNEFTVFFLTEIPASDDDPIDQAWVNGYATTSGPDAKYVYVRAQSRNLLTLFFNPLSMLRDSVPVAATSVAMSDSAACYITPLYICNPFEADQVDLQEAFFRGDLHGRLFKLHPKGSDTERPGNFGFLEVMANPGADAIRDIFAGDTNPTCYAAGEVTTKPGATDSIRQGLNVRFDLYAGQYNPRDYRPALNVRKGYVPKNPNSPNACDTQPWEDPDPSDDTFAGFPENEIMVPPSQGALGATIGEGNWDVERYWELNHGSAVLPADMYQSFNNTAGPGAVGPSRYDVYRYEIDHQPDSGWLDDEGTWTTWGTGEGENGHPICSNATNNALPPTDDPDRRVIFAAMIDCLAEAGQGKTTFNVNSYASIFLVAPMARDPADPSADSTIDVEIIDITGYGGNGTLDAFIRDEAILVR
jgi:Flp pilus assembly protein TadG